ncbi:MAG TPA: histidine kinase [Steroidobacteraceae bacterium]|nr:histidine kinase [Steroidobacteraceae bacterium]
MPVATSAPDPLSPHGTLSRRSYFLYELAAMIVFNFLIAVLLILLGDSRGFLDTLKLCNAIGFCIWGAFELARFAVGERVPMPVLALIAVPAGFIAGSKIAALLGTVDIVSLAVHDPAHELRSFAGGLMVAMFATGFFIFYWRAESYRADLQSERRRAAEALQSETQARLALLQAQIEPHFLFNTLANAQSVIDSDPQTAKSILEHLNQYLRVSLGRTRRSTSTLADEVSLVSQLLAIAQLRLGARLRYSVDVPMQLQAVRLPPLLVQPLVENALKHGIEPAVSGGEIRIVARREGDSLCLRVTDTGIGLNAGSPEGIGLGNVRGRLQSLYGERGRLALYGREPHGVVAELTLPLEGA